MSFDKVDGTNNIVFVANQAVENRYSCIAFDVEWAGDAATKEEIRVGIFKDTTIANYIAVDFNRFGGNVYNRTTGAAVGTFTIDLTQFTSLMVCIHPNSISAWGWNGKTWVCIKVWDITAQFNLSTLDLTGWSYGWFTLNDSASAKTTKISNIKITGYGGMGGRDQTFITYENGEPVRGKRGEFYYTGGVIAPGAGYLGVFEYDPVARSSVQIGQFEFGETVGGVTTRYGGGPGHLFFDRTYRVWRLVTATYNSPTGASSTSMGFKTFDFDPRWGYTYIDDHTLVPNMHNDCFVTVDENRQYNIVYNPVATTPAVRRASTFEGLMTAVPTSIGINDGEGNIISKIGGVYYTMCQTYNTNALPIGWRCWKLSDLSYAGLLGISPTFSDMISSHANLIAWPVNGKTVYIVLNSTGVPFADKAGDTIATSNGETLVWETSPVAGKEWADLVYV